MQNGQLAALTSVMLPVHVKRLLRPMDGDTRLYRDVSKGNKHITYPYGPSINRVSAVNN
jgi:hypothetical protein